MIESGEDSERVTGYDADEDSMPVSPSTAFQLLTEAKTNIAPDDDAEMSDGSEGYDPHDALDALEASYHRSAVFDTVSSDSNTSPWDVDPLEALVALGEDDLSPDDADPLEVLEALGDANVKEEDVDLLQALEALGGIEGNTMEFTRTRGPWTAADFQDLHGPDSVSDSNDEISEGDGED